MKSLKHINDEEYLDYFLRRETDPLILEFASKGEEKQKKCFYIINEIGDNYGFFAEFHAVLSRLAFCDMFGFTPIVSWGERFLYYEKQDDDKPSNAFEYFFKQPTSYTFEDAEKGLITKAKAVQGLWIERLLEKGMDLSEEYENEISEIYKKYICFQDDIEVRLKEESARLLNGRTALGVHFRGTDFKMNYDSHPINVTMEQEFEAIDAALQNSEFEIIFLATDEAGAIARFRERYGEKVVCYTDVFRGDTNVSVAFSTSSREKHKYMLAYEVIRDMYTLSICQGLIAGVSQVSICARIAKKSRNEKYGILNIINNGKNQNNKKFS